MIVRVSLCTLVALTALACTQRPPAEVADVVILDAAVVTMDPAQPQAGALAMRDGKIAFVGDNDSALKWVGEKTRVVRAAGATVLPGLIDSHIHAMSGALSLDCLHLCRCPADPSPRLLRSFVNASHAHRARAGWSCRI